MRRRWFIWLTIAALGISVSACGIKKYEEESVSSTGYPSDEIQRASLSYKGTLYLYAGDGFDLPLGEGFTKAGTVENISNLEYPNQDFQGTRLEIGQEVYVNPEDSASIYIKYDNGYALFKQDSMNQFPGSAADVTADSWDLPEIFIGTWQLDVARTEEHLRDFASLSEMFGTGLGTYGASMEIGDDGTFRYSIGIGIGGTGQCEADDGGIRVSISPFQDTGDYEDLLRIKASSEQGTTYLIMRYGENDLYWSLDSDGERYFEKDGISYEKVRDLEDGLYHWASALTEGTARKDDHGHDTVDYNSQERSFVCLDDGRRLGVRRWDNLCGSAGEYLIYEYDGTTYISKSDDLYQPILVPDSSYGNIVTVPGGYIMAGYHTPTNEKKETVSFYDKDFQLIRTAEGYRATEISVSYEDGFMAVRNMETGLMGFMDQEGIVAIPCACGYVSQFSNGYASVLMGADMISYTEDSGTVPMFESEGGQWGIIDTHGSFVVEPSERFANQSPENPNETWYCGPRRFSPVREDGTTDFIALDENDKVIETIQIPMSHPASQ